MSTSPLETLVGAYFHQDMFDHYDDEFAAVDDFIASDISRARVLPAEISQALTAHPTEEALGQYLRGLGLAFSTNGLSYREWLTQIAEHVRAAGQR